MGAEISLLLALALSASDSTPLPSYALSKVEDKEWVVTGRSVGRASRASTAQVEVEVKSRAGFHINDDYPLNFKPKTSHAAKFARDRIDREDGMTFETCRSDAGHRCVARIPVSFTPNIVGKVEVSGTVAFSVCDPNRCLIKKVGVTVPVHVADH